MSNEARNLLVLVVGLTACVADPEATPSSSSPCDVLAARAASCLGTETAPSASCDPATADRASALLGELDTYGCALLEEGKTDGSYCDWSWWPGWGCMPQPDAPLPEGRPARFPFLLAHGFNTSTTNFWRFNDVDVALERDGHVVRLGSVPPFDASPVRAQHLADQVDALLAETGAEKVNLICFSQGGVDCRYLVSPAGLGYGDRVASVSLISAPNRGTNIADSLLRVLPDASDARLVDLATSWYGSTFSELADDSHFVAAMESMSEQGMARFNDLVTDADGVYYQSWAGVSFVNGFAHPNPSAVPDACTDDQGVVRMLFEPGVRDEMDPLLSGGAAFVAHLTELRPNDGVSTVESSKWARFRGCIAADHLDQVGQVRDRGRDPRTGFDYLRFYREMAFELASMGY